MIALTLFSIERGSSSSPAEMSAFEKSCCATRSAMSGLEERALARLRQ